MGENGFSHEESHPVLPVYLLVDVSYSMAGAPIDAMNAALPRLKDAIKRDPVMGEMARISLITFSDQARVALPISDLLYAELPELHAESGTNFAAAFRCARTEIESSIRSLGKGTSFHKPVVFFLSDGEHVADEDWEGPLRDLTDRSWMFNPEIVAFGFGDANEASLGAIATRHAFMSKDIDPVVQVREIISTLIQSIKTTSGSLHQEGAGGLIVEADSEKFTPLPVMQI